MSNGQRNISILIGYFICTAAQASDTPRVAQSAIGTCNQNNLTIYQTPKVIGGRVLQENLPTFSTSGPPCIFMQIGKTISALENAQLQLLIAEHPTRLSLGFPLLGVRLGERADSIWVDVNNESAYDVHGLRIDPATAQHNMPRTDKAQTYLTSSLPDAVVSTKNLVLKGGDSARLLAANPSVVAAALAQVPRDWCLFDLGSRATNSASEGYEQATASKSQTAADNPDYKGDHASYEMVPMVFTVRYSDIFEVVHEVPVSTYLRVASPDSTSVFYPSRRAYGPLECHNR